MFGPLSGSDLLGVNVAGSVRSPFTKELDEDALRDPLVDNMIQSFRYVRCAYEHFDVPSHHYLHALRALLESAIKINYNCYDAMFLFILHTT